MKVLKKIKKDYMNMLSNINIKIKLFSKFYTRYKITKYINDFISTIPKNHEITLLEVGAKNKNYFKNISNIKRITLDINANNKPDIVSDICDLRNISDNSFDYVVMLEVLEHVHNPQLAIIEVYRVLKKDGILLMTTPFLFPIHDAPYDFFRYTKYGLTLLCKNFNYISVKNFDYFFVSIWTLFSRLTMVKSKKQQIIGISIFIISLPFLPVAIILDYFTKIDLFTSRYITIAKKGDRDVK